MSAPRLAVRLVVLTALVVLLTLLGSQIAAAQETSVVAPAAPAFTYGPYDIVDAISQWCQWNSGSEQCFDVPPNPPTVRWTNGCKQVRLTYDAPQAFDGQLTVYGYFDGPSQPYEDLRATVNGVSSDWYDSGVGEGWHAVTLPATYHFAAGANYIYLTHPHYPYPEDCKYWGSIHFTDPSETETGWFALGDPPAPPPPGPPTNVSPFDGTAYCEQTASAVVLNWTCSGNECYVQLARDSGFTNLVASYGWTTNTSWDVTALVQGGGDYYWRVKARNDGGEGTWGPTWRIIRPRYVGGTITVDTIWDRYECPYYVAISDVTVASGYLLKNPGGGAILSSKTRPRVVARHAAGSGLPSWAGCRLWTRDRGCSDRS